MAKYRITWFGAHPSNPDLYVTEAADPFIALYMMTLKRIRLYPLVPMEGDTFKIEVDEERPNWRPITITR